jgi:hypothetical protein
VEVEKRRRREIPHDEESYHKTRERGKKSQFKEIVCSGLLARPKTGYAK